MTDPFNTATPPSAGVDFKTINGALLLITVHTIEHGIITAHSKTAAGDDAVRCDIVVLDGPLAGDEYADTLVFPIKLQRQLGKSVGGKMLGRLGQDVAKPGKNPAWILDAPTEADKVKGKAYLSGQFASAAPSTNTPPF